MTRVKRPDPQADGLREASVDTVGVGGKYEAGQKIVKARSMYFLKAAGAAEKQRSGNQCAANTEITELGVSQASSREAGTGVGQVADRKATAKLQPSVREQPPKVEKQGVPLSLQWETSGRSW